MGKKNAKPTTSSAGAKRRPSASRSSMPLRTAPDLRFHEKAVADFLARSAEEIQSHLALAAQVKSKMAQLLGATIEELERARRLETLASSIAEAVPDLPAKRLHRKAGPSKTMGAPESYFDREIKTLKKAQKILGIPAPPATEPAPPPPPPSPFPPAPEIAEPIPTRTVLLLEDDHGTVRLLKYFLEKENIRVLTSDDGPEGFRTAVRERPDLILLDIMIPGMDGYQLLKDLKKNEATSSIPVFVLSILAQETDILKAIERGASDYFTKPFSPPVLIAKVQRALEARRG